MEDSQCRNLIENARIAKGQDNAILATEPADWRCKREKCALRAFLTAAENARIAVDWAVLTRQGIRLPLQAKNDG